MRLKAGASMRSHAPLVLLLAAAIFINYVDRGNLATATPLMKTELKLSNAEIGLLASAFYWVYAPGQIVAAWFVQRLNPYRALTWGLVLWSAATMLSGFAGGFVAFLSLRVLLGLGESAGFPASSKLLAQRLPHHRLGISNALISAGIDLGPAIGTFIGGLLIAKTGWRPLFIVFGAASLLWLLPWLQTTKSLSFHAAREVPATEPSFRELLSKREMWAAAGGLFANNYLVYLVLTWLPLFLVRAHGYSITEMAKLGGLVYAASAVIGLISGTLADWLMARGVSGNLLRKGMMCAGQLIGMAGMFACGSGDAKLAVLGLFSYSLFHGLTSFNNFAIGQTLAGPRAAAKWMGVQNGIGNIAGIVSPVVTGLIIDLTGQFTYAFWIAAVVLLAGLFCWSIVIRRVEPLRWSPLSG
jgi:MFS family permease